MTHPVRYSFSEYIAHGSASNVKHEFLAGQILSVGARLDAARRGTRYRGHMADLGVRVLETGLATPEEPSAR
jgi:hypothetical protein